MYRGIYLAGPITGLTFEDATHWRELVKSHFRHMLRAEVFDPMRGITRDVYSTFVADAMIAEYLMRDLTDIDRCDFILVNWAPCQLDKPSVGTCIEIGYAMAKGKRIISIVDPEKPCHPWIPLVSDVCVPDLNTALHRLYLLTEGPNA